MNINRCLNIPREVRGAEYVNLVSHGDNAPFATAGDRFSVTFGLLDQFGKSFAFPSHGTCVCAVVYVRIGLCLSLCYKLLLMLCACGLSIGFAAFCANLTVD